MKLQPVAMIVPNDQSIYAPSRLEEPVEKNIAQMRAKQLFVSHQPDGISDPQQTRAYSWGTDCWYIEAK